jgi:hypothetical protein
VALGALCLFLSPLLALYLHHRSEEADAMRTLGSLGVRASQDLAAAAAAEAENGGGDGWDGGHGGSLGHHASVVRQVSLRLRGTVAAGVKKVAPTSGVGTAVLMLPLAAVIVGIRYRHYQVFQNTVYPPLRSLSRTISSDCIFSVAFSSDLYLCFVSFLSVLSLSLSASLSVYFGPSLLKFSPPTWSSLIWTTGGGLLLCVCFWLGVRRRRSVC